MTNNLMNEVDFLAFDSRYKSLLKSNVSLIDKVIAYLCKKRGKFIRPALVVNVAKSLGSLDDKNYTVASLIEMMVSGKLDAADAKIKATNITGMSSPSKVPR